MLSVVICIAESKNWSKRFSVRVISGYIKGHKLQTARGSTVRPTADRVKEAMFNILTPPIAGTNVLDLFAGSGALGIEALSRGALSAVFIDCNLHALSVLRKNLKHCKIVEKSTVIQWNIEKSLTCLKGYPHKFDLVFMDPPYRHNMVTIAIKHLLQCDCMADSTKIIAEHEPGCRIQLPGGDIRIIDTRRYGSNQLSFFSYLS